MYKWELHKVVGAQRPYSHTRFAAKSSDIVRTGVRKNRINVGSMLVDNPLNKNKGNLGSE